MSDPEVNPPTLLRSMADASPLAIAVSEGAAHVLRYVNPAFCQLYGIPAAELLGRPFAEACPEGETAAAKTLLDRVFETGAAGGIADLSRAGQPDDAVYWSYAAWPLTGHAGVVSQITDTTQRHLESIERHGQMQHANQQLLLAALREDERSDKLVVANRMKDEFVAMLAHELRNPLSSIRTGIYLLNQRAGPQDTSTRETCALLERQMRHLLRLLDDLLDVSRITQGKISLHLEPVDVISVLHCAVAASRSLLELKGHQLSLDLPSEPVWVDADPVRLEQVLTNLLQNAGKYMDFGGQVWLSLEKSTSETGDGPTGRGAAVIRVRDSGIGISPEALLHIFDLFVQVGPTLARSEGGLGIGLTLVKSLVELHGGRVDAQSAGLGRGSEFRVQLPLLQAPPQRATGGALPAEPSASPTAAGKSVSVLVVEDNVAAAVTLGEVLELWGYEARLAHTGEIALAAAVAACPDVALLDIGLPGMDGYELARRLRSEPGLPRMRLVALTGYGQEKDRQRSREAGFDHHLIKPIDLDELNRIISTCEIGATEQPDGAESAGPATPPSLSSSTGNRSNSLLTREATSPPGAQSPTHALLHCGQCAKTTEGTREDLLRFTRQGGPHCCGVTMRVFTEWEPSSEELEA